MTAQNPDQSSGSHADFAIFQGDDELWVLRDTRTFYDYPFINEMGAVKGMDLILRYKVALLGSPSSYNAYGAPETTPPEATA